MLAQPSEVTIIRGMVVDSVTEEPLPFAGVIMGNLAKNSTVTDEDGVFTLVSKDTFSIIKVTCLGYQPVYIPIQVGINQYLNIGLKPESKVLSEVVVKGKRKRYRNKSNPAVDLIGNVIENKSKNRIESLDNLEYKKYQKIVFSFDNLSEGLMQSSLLKQFSFIFDNIDTTISPGRKLLPVYIKEDLTDYYYRKKPRSVKEIEKAEQLVRFDEYLNRRSLSAAINYLSINLDIYNNNITLLGNQFLSPIASIAPAFYKYFIKDTVSIDSVKSVRLDFQPRNKADFLFQGELYVTLDSSFAVNKINMSVNKDINLNWVKSLSFSQKFAKIENEDWMVTMDQMSIDFGITKESIGVFAQRTAKYWDYHLNRPLGDSIFHGQPFTLLPEAEDRNQYYWNRNRPIPLSTSEQNIYILMDSLKRVPAFRRDVKIISLFTAGYLKFGIIELGPASTFYSYNPIEGSRFKFGGRTTPAFSKKINFESYIAYGAKDEKFKSYFGTTFSLTNKTIFDFPVKSIQVSYQYDMKIPGEELQYAQDDNLLLSIKRGKNDKMYYNRTFRIDHSNEFLNHFSYEVALEYNEKAPAGNLYFNNINYLQHINTVNSIGIVDYNINLRYAPNEKFFQGSMYRTPFPGRYPVFQLQYTQGLKMIGSDYDYQSVQFNTSKRFYLSIIGYSDVTLEAGKVFGRVPYPLLNIHRANQTYTYQAQSYNLMNFLEFVSDQYVSLNIEHNFNGFFFNKIPLFKKLLWRETLVGKFLYGSLNNINDPTLHPKLFQFPVDDQGAPLTYTFGKMPYIEAGFGISNILRVFRVDYVQRLTYLNHPNISKAGIRFGLKFEF